MRDGKIAMDKGVFFQAMLLQIEFDPVISRMIYIGICPELWCLCWSHLIPLYVVPLYAQLHQQIQVSFHTRLSETAAFRI